jgi:hypothetical protein
MLHCEEFRDGEALPRPLAATAFATRDGIASPLGQPVAPTESVFGLDRTA